MLREQIKHHLVQIQDERYEKELLDKVDSYTNWYRLHKMELDRRMNETDHSEGEKLTREVIRYSHLRNYLLSGAKFPDIIICCDDEGTLTDYAEKMICDYFAANPDINLVYGDEDRLSENSQLKDAWLKSDWAPDTFLSTFYFGKVFAIRSSELFLINPGDRKATDYESKAKAKEDTREEANARQNDLDDSMRSWIYDKLCLKIAQADGGFTRRKNNRFPIGHIPEILFHSYRKGKPWDSNLIKDSLTGRYSSESAEKRLISIIIPSKDNPEILGRCIHSIEKYADNSPYEIIVVDNGSSPENKAKVEKLLEEHNETGSARLLYQPMEFNFSAMCNLGASEANGELLLFLNDDIEIARPNWLSYLSEKAKLPYVGCVGMKLLYPNSEIIQHAGVVNVKVGPIHKLQYCSNREEHYFGFNKGVRNVIAVTGACLMIRNELFWEVGGFDAENFAVAFNDIDLCLKVFEKGYYNVVRNNMYLYHHESLSRGDDREDKVKALRLSGEQERLLNRHPDLFRRDPYYHPYLEQDPAVTEFKIATEDALLQNPHYMDVELRKGRLKEAWEDPVLRLGVEYAGSLSVWLCGPMGRKDAKSREEDGYYIKGYAFVIDADNAVYDRTLLFRKEEAPSSVWQIATERVYRPDIAEHLTDQKNDALTGFMTAFRKDALKPGRYQIGMLAKDNTSRQRIVFWSDVYLTIPEQEA